jgi:ESCRT-II complex subunit VPS36
LCFAGKKDRDAIEQQLQKAMQRKAWQVAAKLQEVQLATHQQTRRRVGVDHILTKHKLKHQQAQKVANEALSGDAEQLLQQASALLQVIQKYTILLNQHQKEQQEKDRQGDNNNDNDGEDDDQDAKRLTGLLQDMGMTSALTKDHVGDDRAYYEWLARQVVDFFWDKLPAMGGVISLTDVYCLFNRARGTNLVSPEDLRQACHLLGDLKLGISQRTFDSGVVVLQLDRQANTSALVALCPTSALEASHVLKVSPLLALEQLKEAEKEGHLCRDTTLETTRFYPNHFDKYYKQLLQLQQR